MVIEADPPTDGFVILEFYSETAADRTLAFSVEIESRGFGGYIEQVWFSHHDLDNFLLEMAALERKRQGEAILRTLSDVSAYALLRFKIYSTDKLGHIALSSEILNIDYVGSTALRVTNKVSVTFQLDPTTLRRVLADFRALKTPHYLTTHGGEFPKR